MVKRIQNTYEESQLDWVKNSKLFHKRYGSIPPHSNFKNLHKPNTKTNSTNTKNQNQANILKRIP